MLKLIKKVFKDLGLLFINFPHWVVSKFLISVFSYAVGIGLSLPFFLVAGILIFLSPVDWGHIVSVFINPSLALDGMTTVASILENIASSLFIVLFSIIAVIVLVVGISYGRVLLFNLNLNYIKGEKLGYMKNRYFDLGFIFKYIKILGLSFIILLAPIVLFIVGMFILLLVFGSSAENFIYTPLSIVSLSLALFCGFVFFYLVYRLTFSFIILCDKDKKEKAVYYIKKSFKLTKGYKHILRFILLCLMVTLVILPFRFTQDHISDIQKRISDYVILSNGNSVGTVYYEGELLIEYGEKTEQELRNKLTTANWISLFLFIFNFFVIYGVYQMVFVSFYVRDLKGASWEKNNVDDKK